MDMSGTSSPPSRDPSTVMSKPSLALVEDPAVAADDLGLDGDVHAVGDDHLDLAAEAVDGDLAAVEGLDVGDVGEVEGELAAAEVVGVSDLGRRWSARSRTGRPGSCLPTVAPAVAIAATTPRAISPPARPQKEPSSSIAAVMPRARAG